MDGLGTGRGNHFHRRHLHRVNVILPRDGNARDLDLVAQMRRQVRCCRRNDDHLRS